MESGGVGIEDPATKSAVLHINYLRPLIRSQPMKVAFAPEKRTAVHLSSCRDYRSGYRNVTLWTDLEHAFILISRIKSYFPLSYLVLMSDLRHFSSPVGLKSPQSADLIKLKPLEETRITRTNKRIVARKPPDESSNSIC